VKLTRRTFLLAATALLAQACTGIRISNNKPQPKRTRYFVPSPGIYIGKEQDFSSIRFDKTLRARGGGIPQNMRSLITIVNDDGSALRRVSVPGQIHAMQVNKDYTYLVSVDKPAVLHLVDTDSFEIIRSLVPRQEDELSFGGHLVQLTDGRHFAVTMNGSEMGKHDYISIRERATLKEVNRFSSYGFEAHDIALSADGKSLFVAHYGSYIGSGPYSQLVDLSYSEIMEYKTDGYGKKMKFPIVYPSGTSVVDISTGKLLDRHSYQLNGPQGHLALGANDAVYTSSRPALVRKRPDSMSHPAFEEGTQKPEWAAGFQPQASSFGTTVVYDPATGQVLIPSRYQDSMLYARESAPDDFQEFDLKEFASDLSYPHALCLHPDGKHYIVTANNWVVAFERESHRFVPEMSFPLELFVHSHFSLV
jgi:hypothetical protein